MLEVASKIKVGRTPRGTVPFVNVGGIFRFNAQGDREVEYGVVFSPNRGYQAYYRFANVPAANTFTGESLREWCLALSPSDRQTRALKIKGMDLAERVLELQQTWVRNSRPSQDFTKVGCL